MPGLEPGNPEGADLQSAAVAAVPHPHSNFQAARLGYPLQAEVILRRQKSVVNGIYPNPRTRAYLTHDSCTNVLPKAIFVGDSGTHDWWWDRFFCPVASGPTHEGARPNGRARARVELVAGLEPATTSLQD